MNRSTSSIALALLSLTAAALSTPVRAEKTMYGLNREQVAFAMACGGESSLRLAEYSLYSTGQPITHPYLRKQGVINLPCDHA